MLTLEGMTGLGNVWVAWNNSTQGTTSAIPSWIGAYVGIAPVYSPVLPTAMFLPPVSGDILYNTLFTPYGGKVSTIDVGTIASTLGDHTTPNPCAQSTITGTLSTCGMDGNVPVLHRRMQGDQTWTGQYYDVNCNPLSFMNGNSAAFFDWNSYNEKGRLIGIPISNDSSFYWNSTVTLLCSHLPSNYSSSIISKKHARHGKWLISKNRPDSPDSDVHYVEMSTWTHVSDNVWLENYWVEYHSSQSYTPKLPLGYSGMPYVVAQLHATRTHTLRFLRHREPGLFVGYFDVTEDIEYYGKPTGKPYCWEATSSLYPSVLNLEVLSPGLIPAVSKFSKLSTVSFNTYCAFAKDRAAILYSEKDMGAARSLAVSDVSALESNWLENFSQVGGYADVFDPLIEGFNAVKANDINTATHALASAYLVYKYCIAPTASDASDLDKNLESQISYSLKPVFSNERRRGRYTRRFQMGTRIVDLSYFCTYHLQLKDNSFALVLNALERLGLDPSASHGWDFIPYSFVVDWFMSIGPALQKISAYNNARLTRELRHRIQTFKVVWPLLPDECVGMIPTGWTISQPLLYSWYDRRVAQRWGTFDPFAGQSHDGLSWSQYAQGTALLVSNLV